MTGDVTAAELRRRAVALATPPPPPVPADETAVLAFVVGTERYLLAATAVARTLQLTHVQRLPAARPPLVGACTVGGRLLPLVDLPALLGSAAPPARAVVAVVVDDGHRPSLALAADRVERLVPLRPSDLVPGAGRSALVRGTTADGAVVLDHDALLDLPDLLPTDRSTR